MSLLFLVSHFRLWGSPLRAMVPASPGRDWAPAGESGANGRLLGGWQGLDATAPVSLTPAAGGRSLRKWGRGFQPGAWVPAPGAGAGCVRIPRAGPLWAHFVGRDGLQLLPDVVKSAFVSSF